MHPLHDYFAAVVSADVTAMATPVHGWIEHKRNFLGAR